MIDFLLDHNFFPKLYLQCVTGFLVFIGNTLIDPSLWLLGIVSEFVKLTFLVLSFRQSNTCRRCTDTSLTELWSYFKVRVIFRSNQFRRVGRICLSWIVIICSKSGSCSWLRRLKVIIKSNFVHYHLLDFWNLFVYILFTFTRRAQHQGTVRPCYMAWKLNLRK